VLVWPKGIFLPKKIGFHLIPIDKNITKAYIKYKTLIDNIKDFLVALSPENHSLESAFIVIVIL
jgi:hypothetical protein